MQKSTGASLNSFALLKWIIFIVIVTLAALIPVWTDNSGTLNLLFLVYLFITLSQSWNILAGMAGQISLGHAAFFGIGALVMRALWFGAMPYLIAMLVAGAIAALCALIVGVPTFRLRGVYFSIGTLALAEALRITVGNVLSNITTMPGRVIANYDLAERYYIALAVALVTMAATFFLLRSRLCLGFFAIREDEQAAEATGVRLLWHKLAASGIASFFAGLAGAIFAFYQVSYYPSAPFSPTWTFDPLLITFVGGVGTLIGPVVGALFFVYVREQLTLIPELRNLNIIIFGILFIVVVLALPGGLMDIWERGIKWWSARRK
ncbi:MAG: branched-chain amino acid ABC transporter permease [Chloroflexi bacterium]|nr:branched-chain amino acid ABC transporter permease [Chloroflexota bacterium]